MPRLSSLAAQSSRGLAVVLFLSGAVIAGLGALDASPDPSQGHGAAALQAAPVASPAAGRQVALLGGTP